MIELVDQHRAALATLCAKYRVRRLDLIGSAARDTFDPDRSDLDFVVQFENLTVDDAADRYFGLLVELEEMFRRKVDLVSYTGIRNPFFRQVIEKTRVPLYAA